MKISERIKEYRKVNNLTQSEFASMLYVSKQAVSKWENENGSPDVSLYPKLAELFNISVDELMGVNVPKKQNSRKKKYYLILLLVIVIFLISTVTIILLINKLNHHKKTLMDQATLILKTEKSLNESLPEVEIYEYVDTSEMSHLNSWYPTNTYYFIFKENEKLQTFCEQMTEENGWVSEVEASIKNILPSSILPYCYNGDYFKIICTNNASINEVPVNTGSYKIEFYCYQKELNRLIVAIFNYEVKND